MVQSVPLISWAVAHNGAIGYALLVCYLNKMAVSPNGHMGAFSCADTKEASLGVGHGLYGPYCCAFLEGGEAGRKPRFSGTTVHLTHIHDWAGGSMENRMVSVNHLEGNFRLSLTKPG